MYYKVLKDNRIIDVLERLVYVRWQEKNKIMVLCDENNAQGIISSDGNYIWHEPSLYRIPVDGYDIVEICQIDEYEYKQLKALNYKTPEEIMDATILLCLERGLL